MWGIKWISDCKLDGHTEYITGNTMGWDVFRTRAEARAFREKRYGYLRNRPDLKAEPFGWKMPQVIKVILSITEDHQDHTTC